MPFYLFRKMIRKLPGVVIKLNEVCIHMMVKGVLFNGTGHSGMGAYHGEWGFREFTHPTTVLKGKTIFNLSLREHPYLGKYEKIKMFYLKNLNDKNKRGGRLRKNTVCCPCIRF